MKKIYVPSAILGAIRAAGFEGRDYLDVNKLLGILSPEDLSFYIFTNLVESTVMPEEITRSFGNALVFGGVTESETKKADSEEVCPPWERIENEGARKDVNRFVNDYCVAHADAVPKLPPQFNVEGMELSSEILWVEGGQVLLLTHVPISEGTDRKAGDEEKNIFNRILVQLSQIFKVEELAKLPIFAGYLRASELVLKSV